MKRLFVALLLSAGVGIAVLGGAALAVDEHAPHGNQTSHPHHVHTGNGECTNIDEVWFEADRMAGVHRAAIESGRERGPWHGTCESHVHTTP